jgi:quercetin dioxygenase-like cupin family protein
VRQPFVAIAVLALIAASCAQDEPARPGSAQPAKPESAAASNAPAHAMFRPDQVKWKEGPPSLPRGARFAVLEGDPAREGYFAMRLKLPSGYRIPPHTHPNVERVTVISGTFHLGMGETFDQAAAPALPAGSYSFMQPGMKHFAWAEGETEIQLATIGPWAINYLNPADDPRR